MSDIIGENTGLSIAVVFVLIGAVFVMLRWVSGSIKIVETTARKDLEEATSLLHKRISENVKEMNDRHSVLDRRQADFELEVAKHYASDDRLHEMETKFTAAIEKLINRFDAFATDFHRIVGKIDSDAQRTPRSRT